MPTIRIPAPLRRFTGDASKVKVAGVNVKEALGALLAKHPELRLQLLDDQGTLRSFVNVFVNEHDVGVAGGQEVRVQDDDVLTLVPVIAGGAPGRLPVLPRSGELGPEELARYARHLPIPQVGVEGQKKLRGSSVLIVGMGGLGSPVALYLAAAGVGRIGIVDSDRVEPSNLQRQILYTDADVGLPKTEQAQARLRAANPLIGIVTHPGRLTSKNALDILRGYDVVVDASDNFPTRYLVNDACVLLGKPDVYASIYRFEGQVSVFWKGHGPCYRCLYPTPPPPGLVPSCAEGGVLGVLPGIVGSLQANEALKLLLGAGRPLTGRLLLLDALDAEKVNVNVQRNPDCPVCGANATVTTLIDYDRFCGLEPMPEAPDERTIAATDLKTRLDRHDDLVLLDVREPFEHEIARIPGSVLIPMSQFKARESEVDAFREKPIIVYCHTGVRSARVANYLRQKGFPRVLNLVGGIQAWSDDVDPDTPTY